jgi:predicted metal-dependent peptidase
MNINNNINKLHPKLMTCLKTMVTDVNMGLSVDFNFYYYFASNINYVSDENLHAAAGVTANQKGLFFYYNPIWLDVLKQEEVNFLLIHELFHLIFDHVDRIELWKLHPKLANVAQDFVINELIQKSIEPNFAQIAKGTFIPIYDDDKKLKEIKRLKEGETYKKEISAPNKVFDFNQIKDDWFYDIVIESDNKCYCVYKYTDKPIWLEMPKEYGDNSRISEYVYFWLLEQKNKCIKDGSCGNNDLDNLFQSIDNELYFSFDDNNIDNFSFKLYKQVLVGNLIQSAKNRGIVTSNVSIIIDKLKESKKNHLEELKTEINKLKGDNTFRTYKIPNRKGIEELRGKYKVSSRINCILDTSGSMFGDFEIVLGIIFKKGYEINLIQCDTEVKNFEVIKQKKQLEELKILGLGGTIIQPAIDFIIENKMNNLGTIILTDGYTDTLNLNKLNKVIIATTRKFCDVIGGKSVKQFIIKDY